MLRTLLLSSALLSATACLPLRAGALVDIGLVDRDTGRSLPEYGHHGRVYVPGEPRHPDPLRQCNPTRERVVVGL